MTTELQNFSEPSQQEIAAYAYYLWESEGRIDGRDLDYWLQAKAHLAMTRQDDLGLLKDGESQAFNKKQEPVAAAPAPASGELRKSGKKKGLTQSARGPAYV